MRIYSAKINVFVRDVETGRQRKSKAMSRLCFVMSTNIVLYSRTMYLYSVYTAYIHTKIIIFTHKKPKTLWSNVFFGIQSPVHVRQVSIKNKKIIIENKVPLPMSYLTFTGCGYSV